MSLQDLANKVCKELPPEWRIQIDLEEGDASVHIVNADGECTLVEGLDLAEATLDEIVEYALREILSEEYAYGENS